MEALYYPILFLFGLAVGSFLNVLILRYAPERSVFSLENLRGRSHCPHCGKTLQWFELVPFLSYIAQGGRCRSCGKKLTVQYPLVEFLSGAIFVALPLYFSKFYGFIGLFPEGSGFRSYYAYLIVWVLILLTWALISVIDMRHYLIPNELNVLLAALGVILVAVKSLPSVWLLPFHSSFLRHYLLIFSPMQNIWINHLLGALAGLLFFGLLIAISRGRAMGMGDVKLAAAAGLILSWPDMALAMIIAFILGGVWGAFLLLTKKKTLRDKLPFAPIMILGMVLTVFFGYQIVSGYFGLFNI
ncbi:MAG: Type 4 prepilin-like protein leader peptide-processing enzyme [Candidatus Jorgensenbacteria bacterium GW2011_GWA1_48_13]|uniref:Type 4 prepilin-like protein leader peptide-processing enzyme n=2 Tax=Candidatus Joergenseniibacteriota TaxID=1752739 RepID=A0A0G1YK37_9BACT|nr:MAG: Type 4 prepilin-like protein leader peptide-processing enzyme [Candidatus Jorgensenbacteria bacterium GW2011_GWA1_48_13]KKU98779.1 MAG: type II secretory pathway, prepilin signal peptidase PulO and related peptidases, leader peptidase (prepilin peptidase) / N-methyltransferase [Candidatus Jorgensenbacteria bacterium GW2011_GWC1_48_8]KKW15372.1 MAG: Type 4 prepilin-like protein leader peptide-processing enzyme [Candidatus Jorgensenbacteria bacterium GW2011_GWB1_50_10]